MRVVSEKILLIIEIEYNVTNERSSDVANMLDEKYGAESWHERRKLKTTHPIVSFVAEIEQIS